MALIVSNQDLRQPLLEEINEIEHIANRVRSETNNSIEYKGPRGRKSCSPVKDSIDHDYTINQRVSSKGSMRKIYGVLT